MDRRFTANLPPVTPRQSTASGIAAVELSAKELDRVSGGLQTGSDAPLTLTWHCGVPIIDEWID
jgi:hypothetical protein